MSLVILIVLVLGVGAGYLMPADVSGFQIGRAHV